MRHLGTKRLETKRLILRQYRVSDAENMYYNWANDVEVTKYLTWPPHKNPDSTRELLNMWIKDYGKSDYYQWVIALNDDSEEVIGSISVVDINEDIEMIELGYCLGKNWWHQGIMSETLKEIIRFFIEEVRVNRIQARHDVRNANSGKVMLACGMKYEGTMHQCGRNNQGLCDCAIYGLIADQYMDIQ